MQNVISLVLTKVFRERPIEYFNAKQIELIRYGAESGLNERQILHYAKPEKSAEDMRKCLNIIFMMNPNKNIL